MEGAPKETVLITGISGYIGSQVCKLFLENGTFKVKGTVRDTKRADKMEPLKKAFGEYFDQLELVEADLCKKETIVDACEGCQYVVHTASPFPLGKPKHEDDLIKPAVEGTLAAMEGAKKHGVKRVVITSSVAAIYKPVDTKQRKYSRADWTDLARKDVSPYEKSKTLAEKAAWDFLKALPENERFELATVNPGLVLGPNLNKANFSSGDVIKKLLTGEIPRAPSMCMCVVDVRDVAKAHLNAILKPEAAGQRFMLVSDSMWMLDLGKELHAQFGKDYPKCAHLPLPRMVARIGSFFNSDMRLMNNNWGEYAEFDNKETREVLDIDFIQWKQSANEMVETLLETGYIPDKRKK